ncbi:hypothetical protein VTO42DRAFT_4093 [Malbranchea cinnamomea]
MFLLTGRAGSRDHRQSRLVCTRSHPEIVHGRTDWSGGVVYYGSRRSRSDIARERESEREDRQDPPPGSRSRPGPEVTGVENPRDGSDIPPGNSRRSPPPPHHHPHTMYTRESHLITYYDWTRTTATTTTDRLSACRGSSRKAAAAAAVAPQQNQ